MFLPIQFQFFFCFDDLEKCLVLTMAKRSRLALEAKHASIVSTCLCLYQDVCSCPCCSVYTQLFPCKCRTAPTINVFKIEFWVLTDCENFSSNHVFHDALHGFLTEGLVHFLNAMPNQLHPLCYSLF